MSSATATHLSRGITPAGITAGVLETPVFEIHGRNSQILILPFLMHRDGVVIHLLH
jgi:hypothetical protein